MRVYISHGPRDQQFADELRRLLTNSGLKVWNPEVEVLPGDNWLLKAGAAFERADGLVFVMSKSSLESLWPRREVQYAICHRKYEGRLITVLLEPRLKFPWILKHLPIIRAVDHDARRVSRVISSIFASTLPPATKEQVSESQEWVSAKPSAKPKSRARNPRKQPTGI